MRKHYMHFNSKTARLAKVLNMPQIFTLSNMEAAVGLLIDI